MLNSLHLVPRTTFGGTAYAPAGESLFPSDSIAPLQSYPTIDTIVENLQDEVEHLRRDVELHNNLLHELSHNVKNPLTTILLLAERIQRVQYDPATAKYFATLYDNVDRICNIINRVSTELRQHHTANGEVAVAGEEVISMTTIIAHLLEEYRMRAVEKSVRIQYHASTEDLYLLGDRSSVIEIFDNLFSNALKYTPFGSTITIVVKHTEQTLTVAIQDEGYGIKDEEKHLLFRKFSTLSARPTNGEESTGLGLYITQRLVHAMGGTISCESTWMHGATFTVQFTRYTSIH